MRRKRSSKQAQMLIAGAGMAGLCAAARACELGGSPVVLEKGSLPGGSMRLSSGVVWRYRSFDDFRAQCPGGDPRLQELVHGHLNEALVRAAGDVRLVQPGTVPGEPVVLATGGFQGDPELVERFVRPAGPLRLRANPWSAGDGVRAGLERGGALSKGLDEFYGRNMADVDFGEDEFVPLAQVYGRFSRIFNERGEEFIDHNEVSWSEIDLVQATAHQPGARAWYLLDEEALEERVRGRTVRELVAEAPTSTDPAELPFPAPPQAVVAVRVAAAITHTIGGLRIDEHARVLDGEGAPIDGLYAAGADAGGISTSGYASGLASALVLGRAAAES